MSREEKLSAGKGRPGRATLKDVARRADVSVQTVSNVVNDTGRLSAATRERVLDAIKALGYQAHAGAASLRSGRANRFAYPLPSNEPSNENTILLEFLQHLVVAADRRHQQVLVVRPDRDDVRAIDDVIGGGSIDAVVLSAIVERDPRVAHLRRTGIPFACFGRTDPRMPQAWVDIDNRAGVRGVTASLVALGHTRVDFLGYESTRRWDLEREAGYRDAMTEAGLRPRITRVGERGERRALATLLGRRARPTAVVTGSDVLGAGCYTAAHAKGMRIGADLAVTGFDGSAVSRLLVPSLTTVAMPLASIADRIVARILGEVPNNVGEVLETEVITGDSTGPLG
jgi:DNA-binding LacI/PurR family transcriptional regulator